jgi:hypothetical protein
MNPTRSIFRTMLFATTSWFGDSAGPAGTAPGDQHRTEKHTPPPRMTRIHIIAGDKPLSATLDDTAAGRDFAALLPLELTLADYIATEKVADLPRRLDTTGAPDRYAPKTGDITYYAPWGNLAIFYKPFRTSSGLVRLGAVDGPIDQLLNHDASSVRIEVGQSND